MSVLGFKVHVDKENATPAPSIKKGRALNSFGLKGDGGKLQQKAPQKTLFDVINEPVNITASRTVGVKQSSLANDGMANSLKPSHKIGLKVLIDTEPLPFKSKPTVTQKIARPPSKPQLEISEEDFPEFPDISFTKLMNDFPPLNPDIEGHKQGGAHQDKDTELSLDQTLDTSISFGSLHVMHESFNTSEISYENSATDLDPNLSLEHIKEPARKAI